MAQIHRATVTPGKLDLLTAWLPGRHWYPADDVKDLQRVGAFRFDDPDGEVGVETFVVRAGDDGLLVQVPMTYRAKPRKKSEAFLIGTTEHSVLGTRYVYDGVGDPVYASTLAAAIRTGGHEADEMVETEDGPQRREPLMTVRGSGQKKGSKTGKLVRTEDGDPAVIVCEKARIDVRRVLTGEPAEGELHLTGAWPGLGRPLVLAVLY